MAAPPGRFAAAEKRFSRAAIRYGLPVAGRGLPVAGRALSEYLVRYRSEYGSLSMGPWGVSFQLKRRYHDEYAARGSRQHRSLCEPFDQRHSGRRDGGRPRRTPQGLDSTPLQTSDAVRREISHHRFRAVELRQFGHQANRGADAIQSPIPDPAHSARLELFARRDG